MYFATLLGAAVGILIGLGLYIMAAIIGELPPRSEGGRLKSLLSYIILGALAGAGGMYLWLTG